MKEYIEYGAIKNIINGSLNYETSICKDGGNIIIAYTLLTGLSFTDISDIRHKIVHETDLSVNDIRVQLIGNRLAIVISFLHDIEIVYPVSPVMLKQYRELKDKHPSAVLLFRTNAGYESYGEDTSVTAKVLGIDIFESPIDGTQERINVTSFPYHQLDTFLPKLIRNCNRVAICDELEQPK